MNTPNHEPANPQNVAECCERMSQYVRRNPVATMVGALGAGLVIGLLVRSMRTETSCTRLAQLVEELEGRLRDTALPAFRKASAILQEGTSALGKGFREGESRVEQQLRTVSQRIQKLFS